MLLLDKVDFSYGTNKILNQFSLAVNDGKCVCLSGPSGCGKTTAIRLLLKLETPSCGRVISPKKISVVFQEDRFVESLSLRKNIRMVLKKEKYEYADLILKKLGIYEAADHRFHTLSGGMKRRAALARAISFDGDALILDEAFNGLDDKNKKISADIIQSEFLDKNRPVLLVTHIASDAELLNAETVKIDK